MGCCGKSRVDNGRPKTWKEDKRSYYSNRCIPPPIVLFLVAVGILLALILLALTIFFVFFWPLPKKPYELSVVKYLTTPSSEGWVIEQQIQTGLPMEETSGPTDPPQPPTTAAPPATDVQDPLTTTAAEPYTGTVIITEQTTVTMQPVTMAATTLAPTTVEIMTTTQEPCDDFEPWLCSLGEPATLCNTTFGLAYCCNTCQVDHNCRDADPACFQVWYYGLCTQEAYFEACCISCTYGGVTPPP